ncbi:alpha/beta hydrolase [Cohaesibacter gelatinilyticus]|uniref:Esterase/lipase superfamily enzyme n=1 Tax=Cohaesibacter gelatinilyticus TaxID=372072 RepID=A0A285N6H3_9HYPH|nr:alpha/beta fold hydrolase [Cohaesibacter gelatinilyticus]SNZ05085.1 Esterase/lipase superfamily enzyme [Cohaesibacter gelatinilyticus]
MGPIHHPSGIHMDRSVVTFPLVLLLMIFLAGCASRGSLSHATPDIPQIADIELKTVFVATNRQREEGTKYLSFGPERSEEISYGRFEISIPPNHKVGEIEWATGKVNPTRHFVTAKSALLSSPQDFRASLSQDLIKSQSFTPGGKKEVILFIHGYNTNFAEGLYRVAQLRHDYEMPSPMVLFSWPSAGKTGLYVYDRDSVIVSRDNLVNVIEQLHKSGVDQITLVAHSMGSSLLMESLRQIHISGRKSILSKVNGVILLSPDIDIDVFNNQLDHIRPLPRPFMIFASQKDEALEISSFLTGKEQRIGNNIDLEKIAHPGISVVDVTDFKGGDSLNHFTVATSPALVNLLKGLQEESPLEALEAGVKQQSLGSQVANTATLPLRILTTTTNAVFSR